MHSTPSHSPHYPRIAAAATSIMLLFGGCTMTEVGSDGIAGSDPQETSTTSNSSNTDAAGQPETTQLETTTSAAPTETVSASPDSTEPETAEPDEPSNDKSVGLLRPNGIADISFGTEAEQATEALSQLLGTASRDSGWVLLSPIQDDEGFSDLPHDAVDSMNVAVLPEVRYLCWDQDPFQTCAIFSGETSNRWFSGWEQAVTGDPAKAPASLMTTPEGWGAGQTAQQVADNTEISGGEGSMALFSGGAYSGRVEGSVPFDDTVEPTIGEYVTCITAWMDRPMPGFGEVCALALSFPEPSTS